MKIGTGFNKFMGINMFESLFVWGEKFFLIFTIIFFFYIVVIHFLVMDEVNANKNQKK